MSSDCEHLEVQAIEGGGGAWVLICLDCGRRMAAWGEYAPVSQMEDGSLFAVVIDGAGSEIAIYL